MGEFEMARQEFENLMTIGSDYSASAPSTPPSNNVKPLTANSQRLKKMEIELLVALTDSDDAIDPLVELWESERADSVQELRAMEVGTCSPGLFHEEEQLRAMIQRYEKDWVEPMSRLALLLFTKGRLEEAIDLTRQVLDVKPWHFEAGQLLVVMLLRKSDYKGAVHAARTYSLPALNDNTNNKRRAAWVEQKVRQAQEMFRQAQAATVAAAQDDPIEECPLEEEFCWQ
jgi:hypothetical protein